MIVRRYSKSRNTNRSASIRQGFWLALVVGSFFSFFNCALISPAMAQEQVLRTLSVTGQGVERIPATLAQVNLGVEIQGKMAAEVQQEVARRTSAVVEFLRSRNVERLQTKGISLRPNYNYTDNQRRLIGYIGTNTVSFRLTTEEVGKLLDEVVQAGATRIDNVSFTATEAEIASAQKEALRKATVEAQEQAETVLKALNFSTKEIIGIQINGANPPQPKILERARFSAAADAEASTPVIGGEQVVNGSVTLQIRY